MTARRVLTAVLCAGLLATGCTSTPEPSAEHSGEPTASASASASVPLPPAAPPPVPTPSTYLALGDSVAAGVGAAAPATGGYVPLLAGLLSERLGCDARPAPGCPLSVRNLAQSGATTATLLRGQMPQALELLRTTPDVRLVTLTIGGNDVVETAIGVCAPDPRAQACSDAVAASVRRADQGIDEALRTLTAAAGPDTTVAVMTYYNPTFACQLASLQPLAERVLEGAGQQPGLNDILRARAADHSALIVETRERLTARADFVGGNDCLHPSGAGHARIAEAFVEVVGEPVTRG
jgi:lysophospholipase L1-like esterase